MDCDNARKELASLSRHREEESSDLLDCCFRWAVDQVQAKGSVGVVLIHDLDLRFGLSQSRAESHYCLTPDLLGKDEDKDCPYRSRRLEKPLSLARLSLRAG
jgi:hypothetical protein